LKLIDYYQQKNIDITIRQFTQTKKEKEKEKQHQSIALC